MQADFLLFFALPFASEFLELIPSVAFSFPFANNPLFWKMYSILYHTPAIEPAAKKHHGFDWLRKWNIKIFQN